MQLYYMYIEYVVPGLVLITSVLVVLSLADES